MYSNTILVVGPVRTAVQRDDITAFSFDVADQLGHPTMVATTDDIDVREYAAVVVYGASLTRGTSKGISIAMILEAEAIARDVPVIVADPGHPKERRRSGPWRPDRCRPLDRPHRRAGVTEAAPTSRLTPVEKPDHHSHTDHFPGP